MKLLIRKYKHKPGSFEPDYSKAVYKTLIGETIGNLKDQLMQERLKNDMVKYTPIEIADILE